MSNDRIKQVLTEMGLTEAQLAAIPDADIEAINKSLGDDVTDNQIWAVLESDEVVAAMESGDAAAREAAIAKALRPDPKGKRRPEEDEDGDDEDEEGNDDEGGDDDEDDGDDEDDDDEDSDITEADIRAAEAQILGEDRASSGGNRRRPKAAKKALRTWLEEDEDDGVLMTLDQVTAPLLKSFDAILEERDAEISDEVVSLRKSVRAMSRKIDMMLEAVEEMERRPTGHKLGAAPYRMGNSPLDETGGDAAPNADIVMKSLLDARKQGIGVDPTTEIAIIRSAERGGAAWAAIADQYESIRESLKAASPPQ